MESFPHIDQEISQTRKPNQKLRRKNQIFRYYPEARGVPARTTPQYNLKGGRGYAVSRRGGKGRKSGSVRTFLINRLSTPGFLPGGLPNVMGRKKRPRGIHWVPMRGKKNGQGHVKGQSVERGTCLVICVVRHQKRLDFVTGRKPQSRTWGRRALTTAKKRSRRSDEVLRGGFFFSAPIGLDL